jgi:hypothetical protein
VRRVEVEQGSPQWKQARVGVVTASRMAEILTPGTLKPAKANALLRQMGAEILMGVPVEDNAPPTAWEQRGLALEAEAAGWYAFDRGVEPEIVGLILTDDGRCGCSPDRLVGDDGGLEIKCPAASTHFGYLAEPGSLSDAYRAQVQGSLWVARRAWWDILSYNPAMPKVVERVVPDPEWVGAWERALPSFLLRLDAAVLAVRLAHPEPDRAANPFL